jgi:hypothetical protein
MSDSLFKDDNSSLRDSGIGGLRSDDDLSRKAAEAMRKMQREDQTEEAQRLLREVEDEPRAEPRRSLSDFDLQRDELAAPAVRPPVVDAGTGRPVQRGQHLADVFTIRRGNRKYLTGESATPASDMWGYLTGLLITGAFLIFMLTSSFGGKTSSGNQPPALLYVFMIGFDVVMVVLMVRAVKQARYFAQHGQLLLGRVVSASGRWVTTGSGKSRSRKYKVTLQYRLALPDGETLENTETHSRNDLARSSLPEPGAPVAALYVADGKQLRLL